MIGKHHVVSALEELVSQLRLEIAEGYDQGFGPLSADEEPEEFDAEMVVTDGSGVALIVSLGFSVTPIRVVAAGEVGS